VPADIKILVIETNERRAGERARQVGSLGYAVTQLAGMPDTETDIPDDISIVMVWSGLLRGTGIDRLRKLMARYPDSSAIFMVENGERIGTQNDVVEGIYDYLVIPSSDLYMKHVIDVAVDRRARFLLEKYYQSYLEDQVSEQLQNISDQQMRLLHSDRLSSIGQVAAGIIHELNNPLTYMKLNLQTMALIQKKLRESFDNAGNALVADAGAECVFRFSSDGRLLARIGQVEGKPKPFTSVSGVAAAPSGEIIACDGDRNCVYRFNSAGDLLGGAPVDPAGLGGGRGGDGHHGQHSRDRKGLHRHHVLPWFVVRIDRDHTPWVPGRTSPSVVSFPLSNDR